MTPATSGASDAPAADASPPSGRGAAASPPATARMATRMPNMIARTAVGAARIRNVSQKTIDLPRKTLQAHRQPRAQKQYNRHDILGSLKNRTTSTTPPASRV